MVIEGINIQVSILLLGNIFMWQPAIFTAQCLKQNTIFNVKKLRTEVGIFQESWIMNV